MQNLSNAEFIVYHIPAKLHRRRGTVQGRMRVTNERILFDANADAGNPDQVVELEIRLAELRGVRKCNTYWLLPNGILLTVHRGDAHKFAVAKRGRLANYLSRRLHAASSKSGPSR